MEDPHLTLPFIVHRPLQKCLAERWETVPDPQLAWRRLWGARVWRQSWLSLVSSVRLRLMMLISVVVQEVQRRTQNSSWFCIVVSEAAAQGNKHLLPFATFSRFRGPNVRMSWRKRGQTTDRLSLS